MQAVVVQLTAPRKIRVLIVDDEPIARAVLREELSEIPEVDITGEAENGQDALKKISEHQPDLVLLDLQMPVLGGFEVIRKLAGPSSPAVVIVTAYDQHAIQAFDTGAIDYLLKPVRGDRLREAVRRAAQLRSRPREFAAHQARLASMGGDRKIVGRIGKEYYLLDPAEILAFQADGELVWIVTGRRRLLATQTLHSLEQHLDRQRFERVHRNAIVNVDHVRKMSALTSQRWLITLSNSTQVATSKRLARRIRGLLR